MERWVVKLDKRQLAKLSPEQKELGTYLVNEQDEHFLVFRDSFVALKVASSLGASRSPGLTLSVDKLGSYQPLAQFANGDLLVSQSLKS